jgi:hypothetical protein
MSPRGRKASRLRTFGLCNCNCDIAHVLIDVGTIFLVEVVFVQALRETGIGGYSSPKAAYASTSSSGPISSPSNSSASYPFAIHPLLMTLDDFRNSLAAQKPPGDFGSALTGLWWDAKGNWVKAHESAQQDESPSGAWVHAYLHRKEGDDSNAGYWYRRAGKTATRGSFEQEWLEIVSALLASS